MSEQVKEPAVTPHRLIGIFVENNRQIPVVMWKIDPALLKALNEGVANS